MSLFRKSLASLPVLIVSLSCLSTGCRKCIPYLMQGAKAWDGHKPGTNLRPSVLSTSPTVGASRSGMDRSRDPYDREKRSTSPGIVEPGNSLSTSPAVGASRSRDPYDRAQRL